MSFGTEQMPDGKVEVRFTQPFQRRLKSLGKRYRQIRKDLQPIFEELQLGRLPGDRISGVGDTVFKVRVANSDIAIGKRGGYRLIYQVVSPTCILLLLIYSKSDQADVAIEAIRDAINEASEDD